MRATIVGSDGFIGRHLRAEFQRRGWECRAVGRGDGGAGIRGDLGHVIYCAGVTSDFLQRPWDTITAHVAALQAIVQHAQFESILYLSSTRVYINSQTTGEMANVSVQSHQRDQLYNITKLLGENICRFSLRPAKIVRLSNVYGPDWDGPTFLTELIRMAAAGRITLKSHPESSKDYVALADVVSVIPDILGRGKMDIYNVASGVNVSHAEVASKLQKLTGCELVWPAHAEAVTFPPIETGRLRGEFSWQPRDLLADLPELLGMYTRWQAAVVAAPSGRSA